MPDSTHESHTDRSAVPRGFRIAMGGLFCLAIGLGLLSVWSRYFIFTDGAVYATLGKNLAEGIGLKYCGSTHLFYPPGYPLAIALFYLIVRNAELAGHLVSFFAYLGAMALTARLAWKIRSSPVFVFLSTSVVTFHPLFFQYSSFVMSEALLVCVVLACANIAWNLAHRPHASIFLWLSWGLLLGYAYLIRADGILYAPLQGLFILLLQWKNLREWWYRMALAIVAIFFVMTPYLILIHEQKGEWMLSPKSSIIVEYSQAKMEEHGGIDETRHTSQLSEDGVTFKIDHAQETLFSFLFNHPDKALERVLFWTSFLFRQNGIAFGWITIPFLLLVCFTLGKRILSRKTLFLFLHLLPIGLFLLLYIDQRFVLTFIPFIGIGIARGVEQLWVWIVLFHKRGKTSWLLWIGIPCFFLVAMVFIPQYGARVWNKAKIILAPQSSLPMEHRYLGEWMSRHLSIEPDTRITHRNPWVSFYAEGCHRRTPRFPGKSNEELVAQLVNWCHKANITYVVVDARMTKPTMPQLAFLVKHDRDYDSLEHIKTMEGDLPKIVLYRVKKE